MKENSKRVAFFDLDNTVIDGSSIYYFVKGLAKSGILQHRQIARFAIDNYKFRRAKEESQTSMAFATKKILEFARGKSQQIISELCEEIVHEFLPKKIFPGMKRRIEEHQSIGHDTWIVSASPIEIASAVASQLKMTGAFGTSGEVLAGRYTGELPLGAMHGMNKAKAVKEIAESNDYDLSKAFAYSDSVNDLPLLVSVGNPFIINPNKELENIALKNKWSILVH